MQCLRKSRLKFFWGFEVKLFFGVGITFQMSNSIWAVHLWRVEKHELFGSMVLWWWARGYSRTKLSIVDIRISYPHLRPDCNNYWCTFYVAVVLFSNKFQFEIVELLDLCLINHFELIIRHWRTFLNHSTLWTYGSFIFSGLKDLLFWIQCVLLGLKELLFQNLKGSGDFYHQKIKSVQKWLAIS